MRVRIFRDGPRIAPPVHCDFRPVSRSFATRSRRPRRRRSSTSSSAVLLFSCSVPVVFRDRLSPAIQSSPFAKIVFRNRI